jgi:hypothetical protein
MLHTKVESTANPMLAPIVDMLEKSILSCGVASVHQMTVCPIESLTKYSNQQVGIDTFSLTFDGRIIRISIDKTRLKVWLFDRMNYRNDCTYYDLAEPDSINKLCSDVGAFVLFKMRPSLQLTSQ